MLFAAKTVDPARQHSGFDDDNGGLPFAVELLKFARRGVESGIAKFAGVLFVNIGHALVFAEIDGQNDVVHVASPSWRLWALVTFRPPHHHG